MWQVGWIYILSDLGRGILPRTFYTYFFPSREQRLLFFIADPLYTLWISRCIATARE
ncbi:hypothetical protein [Photorhabdus bodei]|uniref:Uncharacterized protein n=1 Tax=Photorhabdus bodei TaxID=2029681 RepID=A0ABX0ALV2_9GAMM|nr:hypothetical protein [Photorhabdus bodei]NDL03998.1 hypothetical protein [Photorhabdus bodei]